MTEEEKVAKRKGFRGENCYRAACDNGEAYLYNEGTRKFYCIHCAVMINRANRDYGHPCLCHYE